MNKITKKNDSEGDEITDMDATDIYKLDLPKNVIVYDIEDKSEDPIKWKVYPLGKNSEFFYIIRYDISGWKRFFMRMLWGYHFEKFT